MKTTFITLAPIAENYIKIAHKGHINPAIK